MGYAKSICPTEGGKVVEVSCTTMPDGVPGVRIVGMSEKAASEMRERMRAALHSLGVPFPRTPVIIDVYANSPLGDTGSLDVPASLALAAATGHLLTPDALDRKLVYGRLSLDAVVRDGPEEEKRKQLSLTEDNLLDNYIHIPCAGRDLAEVASMCADPAVLAANGGGGS